MAPVPLHRTRSGAVLLGVCAGLGRYFDVDPVLIRVAFLLLTLASGLGVVIYLMLALVMPAEASVGESTAEVVRENLREMGGVARAAGREVAAALRQASVAGRRRKALGVGLALVGVVLLLANAGVLAWLQWRLLWPLILVLVGIALATDRG